jgi:hypothetical protein
VASGTGINRIAKAYWQRQTKPTYLFMICSGQDPSWLEGLVVSLVERTDESPINGRGGSNRI